MLGCTGLPLPTITTAGSQSAVAPPAGSPPIGPVAAYLRRQEPDDSDKALDDGSMYSCFNRGATIAAGGGETDAAGKNGEGVEASASDAGAMYPLSSFYASLSQSRFPAAPAGSAGYSAEQFLRVRPPHLVYPLAARPPAVGVGVTSDEGQERRAESDQRIRAESDQRIRAETDQRITDRLTDKCRPVLKFSVNAILGDDREDREEQLKKGEHERLHREFSAVGKMFHFLLTPPPLHNRSSNNKFLM